MGGMSKMKSKGKKHKREHGERKEGCKVHKIISFWHYNMYLSLMNVIHFCTLKK